MNTKPTPPAPPVEGKDRFLLACAMHLLERSVDVINSTAKACECRYCTASSEKLCEDILKFLLCLKSKGEK